MNATRFALQKSRSSFQPFFSIARTKSSSVNVSSANSYPHIIYSNSIVSNIRPVGRDIGRSKRYFSDAKVTTNSWASERLQKTGEKLETVPAETQILSEEALTNPSEKVKKLGNEILSLNMIEVNQLLKVLTTRLGVSDDEINVHSFGAKAAAPAAGATQAAAAVEAAPEPAKAKEAWDLKLVSFAATAKIKVIKEVRTVTNLGLKEAKELVEKTPAMLKQGLKKEEAEAFQKLLTEAGAVVELL